MRWSQKSKERLAGLDPGMRRVMYRAIGYGVMDMTVVETIRTREKQDEYFEAGKSRVRWPNGKHNVTYRRPMSLAVDVAPYIPGKGLSWDKRHCCVMAGLILAAAKEEKVNVRWGGNWDMDAEPITDQDFQDLVHFEVVEV